MSNLNSLLWTNIRSTLPSHPPSCMLQQKIKETQLQRNTKSGKLFQHKQADVPGTTTQIVYFRHKKHMSKLNNLYGQLSYPLPHVTSHLFQQKSKQLNYKRTQNAKLFQQKKQATTLAKPSKNQATSLTEPSNCITKKLPC